MNAVITGMLAAATVSTSSGQGAQPFVVKADADRLGEATMLFGASPNRIKVSAQDTQGRLAMFEYAGHVRGGPPLHTHMSQDEIFFIRAGDYLFQVGDQQHRLGTGDTIFLPRGIPHTFSQLSAEGRMVFMFTPAGDLEAFFREQGKLQAPPSPTEAADMFARHGMQVVGPPLPMD